MNSIIRHPYHAGTFYPADPDQLQKQLDFFLGKVKPSNTPPKAMIVPHAGYIYSGAFAASAYNRLRQVTNNINRVVILGPSHYHAFKGVAACNADTFTTPLGDIQVDAETIKQLFDLKFVATINEAHAHEHSLEVQLPFLQHILQNFLLVPLVVGDTTPEHVCKILENVWNGPETLIVISSDLSHFENYTTAQSIDRATSQTIEKLQYEQLSADSACGRIPISGLLSLARKQNYQVKMIDLGNSGDTGGDKNRVVGYGAYVLE